MTLHALALTTFTAAMLAWGTQASASLTIPPEPLVHDDPATFAATHPGAALESFESVAGRVRSGSPVSTPGFTVTPLGTALLGVQTGTEAPETGFGTGPTDGTRYLFSWLPGLPTGSLRFDLSGPATAFGLQLTDLGETPGEIQLQTDSGASVTVHSFNAGNLLPNGSVLFAGLSQATPFQSVTLTITGVDEAYGIDLVAVQAVPEPGEWSLLLAGLGTLALALRRRRTAPLH